MRTIDCDEGATAKTLWRGHDGTLVESVLMRYPDRTTVCVSSQAGCGMACPFCATGQAGLTRNLSTAEIVEQVVAAQRTERPAAAASATSCSWAWASRSPTTRGSSTPSAGSPSRRRTASASASAASSVSTVGLVPAIAKLTDEGLQVTLALSLHAPDDELRDTLVPVNTRWPVREVLDAALGYTRRTGRRLSIEYALIRDVNDQPWRADLLAKRLAGKLVHVNLIPLNPTPGSQWDASPKAVEQEFVRRLRAGGVNATVRDTRGREIAGACGQLSAAEAWGGPGRPSGADVAGDHRDVVDLGHDVVLDVDDARDVARRARGGDGGARPLDRAAQVDDAVGDQHGEVAPGATRRPPHRDPGVVLEHGVAPREDPQQVAAGEDADEPVARP